ncbi:MAG: hypothetical protein NTV63_00220 [Candidatus Woesearchaeota archaeon]|nr:hypothetical protein [Candidatus Woesearchaeota archaeon]
MLETQTLSDLIIEEMNNGRAISDCSNIIMPYKENPLISRVLNGETTVHDEFVEFQKNEFGTLCRLGLKEYNLSIEKDLEYGRISDILPVYEFTGKSGQFYNIGSDIRKTIAETLIGGLIYFQGLNPMLPEIIGFGAISVPIFYFFNRIWSMNRRIASFEKKAFIVDSALQDYLSKPPS